MEVLACLAVVLVAFQDASHPFEARVALQAYHLAYHVPASVPVRLAWGREDPVRSRVGAYHLGPFPAAAFHRGPFPEVAYHLGPFLEEAYPRDPFPEVAFHRDPSLVVAACLMDHPVVVGRFDYHLHHLNKRSKFNLSKFLIMYS